MNLQQHEKQHLQQHEPWMLSSLSSWTCRSSMLSTSSSELSMTGKHLVWQHLQKHFLHLSNVWVNMRITGRIKNIIIHETTIDDSYLVSQAPSIGLEKEAKKVSLTKIHGEHIKFLFNFFKHSISKRSIWIFNSMKNSIYSNMNLECFLHHPHKLVAPQCCPRQALSSQ